jgi:polyisoprenoid-binding protein YceI
MGLFARKSESAPATTAPTTSTAAAADLAHLTGDYTIDHTHSRVGFTVRHAMVTNMRGAFSEFEGKLHLDGTNPSKSTAELVIKVASINSAQAARDEHLLNDDFLAADTYPEITFRSTSAEAVDAETYRMAGDLTIKGVTRPVSIDLEFNGTAVDPYGLTRVGFEGTATINRSDWGLTYNAALETGGVLIGEKVKLTFDVSAVKAA